MSFDAAAKFIAECSVGVYDGLAVLEAAASFIARCDVRGLR